MALTKTWNLLLVSVNKKEVFFITKLVSSDTVIPIPLRPALTMCFKDEPKNDSAHWLLYIYIYI